MAFYLDFEARRRRADLIRIDVEIRGGDRYPAR